MTTTEVPSDGSGQPRLASLVGRAIHRLQQRLLNDDASARATVAELRGGIGRAPENAPQAWAAVTSQIIPEFPEAWLFSDTPSAQESAAYAALTFWALHQQSQNRPMHVAADDPRRNFGHAIGQLAARRGADAVKRRFDAMVLSPTEHNRLQHSRGLVQLLRAEEIPTDYGSFAHDWAQLQFPDSRRRVLLRWGRSFWLGQQASAKSSN